MTIRNDADAIMQAALHAALPDTAVKKALDETQLLFDSLMQEYFG